MSQLILEKANIIGSSSSNLAATIDTTLSVFLKNPDMLKMYDKYFPKTKMRYGVPSLVREIDKFAKEDRGLTKTIKSRMTADSTVIVTPYITRDKNINAFTIPGLQPADKNVTLGQAMFGSFVAKKFGITGSNVNGKIYLSSASKVEPLIFITSGLLKNKKFTMDEKIAIMMHEVGHWSSAATTKQAISSIPFLFRILSGTAVFGTAVYGGLHITRGIWIILWLTSLYLSILLYGAFSRGAEFSADQFAKNVGYGVPLATSLQRMTGWKKTASTAAELKQIRTISDMLSPVVDFITASTHPDTYRRSNRVLEGGDIVGQITTNAAEIIVGRVAKIVDAKIAKAPLMPILAVYGKR